MSPSYVASLRASLSPCCLHGVPQGVGGGTAEEAGKPRPDSGKQRSECLAGTPQIGTVSGMEPRTTARLGAALAVIGVLSACGSGGLTAEQVVEEFRARNLAVNNPRDNTDQMCASVKCDQLITTDDVSVYVFSDPLAQQKWAEARGAGGYSRGDVVLSFAPDQAQGSQQDSYLQVLEELVPTS